MLAKNTISELGGQNNLSPSQITGREIGKITSTLIRRKSTPSLLMPVIVCKRFPTFRRSGGRKDHRSSSSQKYLALAVEDSQSGFQSAIAAKIPTIVVHQNNPYSFDEASLSFRKLSQVKLSI